MTVLIRLSLCLSAVFGAGAYATPFGWAKRCGEDRLAVDRATAALPSYFWSDAEYAAYLAWVHREVPTGWQKLGSHPLETVLGNLRLTPGDLAGVTGRVLLAGEGDLEHDGLFQALRHARGGRDRDLVALDLTYPGRTAVVVQGTVTRLPFKDDSFDHVFSNMVAHYLRSHDQFGESPLPRNLQSEFILEVIRVLRPGGHARVGLFINQHIVGTTAVSEIDPIRAATGDRARLEAVVVRPEFSTLLITK